MNVQRLISILEDASFKVALAEGGTELVITCPLCFDERPRLYIEATTGAWICFRCNERGGLRRLLIEVCELPPNEAYPMEMALLAGKKRQQPGLIVSRPAPPSMVELPSGFQPDPGDGLAAQYLQSRGLRPDWAEEMKMGYCLVGYYHHRVIVPVYTQGALRTFVARSWLPDVTKKVLMPEGSQAERALFGYDTLRVGDYRYAAIILVEGVFDALRMWELGHFHTLATLGAHITDIQRILVKRLAARNVVLLRDADTAGWEAAIKEARELAAAMIPVSIALLPAGDPGAATPAEIRQALETAKPVELDYGIESQKEVHR